jgi:TM2 domain-containing membrane protein YozV
MNKIKATIFSIILFFATAKMAASPVFIVIDSRTDLNADTVVNLISKDTSCIQSIQVELPTTNLKTNLKKKKLIAALCAFPFPLGFVGGHRVLLGSKPWIPIVYVATFGGCFGLLPLIDFCVILHAKDITPYENNPNIFMWIK